MPRTVFIRIENGEVLPDDLFARVALDALGTRIPGVDSTADVDHVDRDVFDAEHELQELLFALSQRVRALLDASPEPLIQRAQLLLRLHVSRHVAEAPDTSDLLSVDELDLREPLVHTPVAHAKLIEAVGRRALIYLGDACAERVWVFELSADVCDDSVMVAAVHDLSVHAKHLQVLFVEARNHPVGIGRDDAVGGRLERRAHHGEGMQELLSLAVERRLRREQRLFGALLRERRCACLLGRRSAGGRESFFVAIRAHLSFRAGAMSAARRPKDASIERIFDSVEVRSAVQVASSRIIARALSRMTHALIAKQSSVRRGAGPTARVCQSADL